ncbi:MAG: hypothetical protein KJP26_12020 [Maribacter sp.]|nr:hypothetical protein [Maribacter sp.]
MDYIFTAKGINNHKAVLRKIRTCGLYATQALLMGSAVMPDLIVPIDVNYRRTVKLIWP